jgi:uncharacterized membrane protein (DUF2068 family)
MHSKNDINDIGLRTVAVLEAAKGIAVLLLGFGMLALIHKDLDDLAERLVQVLHVNPEGKLSNLFYSAADHATDKGLLILALGALVYAVVRFTEAYGLWHEREWAEWFALLSGSLYLPWEIYGIFRHANLLKWSVLAVNTAIVTYMLILRVDAARKSRARGE